MIVNSFEPKPNPELSGVDQLRGDYAYPDPGKHKSLKCGICGTEMDVQRNTCGPTSFGGAIQGRKRDHDAFHCPHREADWHVQAKKLIGEIRETPSQRLAQIIHGELCHILKTRIATKKVSRF